MKKKIFTLSVFLGLLMVIIGNSVNAQSYGFYTEKPGYMQNGDFLTDPDLTNPYIGVDRNATMSYITSGHADSVYYGSNAIHVVFTDDAEGKDRLEFKVDAEADKSFFNSAYLIFWIKLNEKVDFNFELNANRNNAGEAKGTDVSMADFFGLDITDTINWQKIVIDLSGSFDGDYFTFDFFESFGFRSRSNPADFIIDEMHVKYYGAYGMYTEKAAWMMDGDIVTDQGSNFNISTANNATMSEITSGAADSVYYGSNAIHAVFTDHVDGKDRLEFKLTTPADISAFNGGELVFFVKLLDTLDMHFEINANRNYAGEAKGSDVSMAESYGLNIKDTVNWQRISIDLTEPIDGDNFTFDIFESFGFRSRGNAAKFLIDEMHVVLSGGYGINADKEGYKIDGDFLTDPDLDSAYYGVDRNATWKLVTSGHADSVYFGSNAVYGNLTDHVDGKDRLEFKVRSEADMSIFNGGILTFWLKLFAPVTDMNFEVNANRNDGGEVKGSDASMKDNFGLDINSTDWQKITIDLSEAIDGDYFNFNMFESFGFRSRGNAAEFMIDEMHVRLSSPVARYFSSVATLDTITLSVGELDPGFSSETTTYDVLVPSGTTTVTVGAVATDANATVEGAGDIDVSSGTASAVITVTAEDGMATMEYTVNITVSSSLQNKQDVELSVYPNPVNSWLTVSVPDSDMTYNISVYDMQGKEVLSLNNREAKSSIDVSTLENGLYMVRVYNREFDNITKISVSH